MDTNDHTFQENGSVWNAPLVIFVQRIQSLRGIALFKARYPDKLCRAGFGTGTKWSL